MNNMKLIVKLGSYIGLENLSWDKGNQRLRCNKNLKTKLALLLYISSGVGVTYDTIKNYEHAPGSEIYDQVRYVSTYVLFFSMAFIGWNSYTTQVRQIEYFSLLADVDKYLKVHGVDLSKSYPEPWFILLVLLFYLSLPTCVLTTLFFHFYPGKHKVISSHGILILLTAFKANALMCGTFLITDRFKALNGIIRNIKEGRNCCVCANVNDETNQSIEQHCTLHALKVAAVVYHKMEHICRQFRGYTNPMITVMLAALAMCGLQIVTFWLEIVYTDGFLNYIKAFLTASSSFCCLSGTFLVVFEYHYALKEINDVPRGFHKVYLLSRSKKDIRDEIYNFSCEVATNPIRFPIYDFVEMNTNMLSTTYSAIILFAVFLYDTK